MEAPPPPDITNLSIVLLGAFWTGTSTVFTGIKSTNEIRDQILNGKIGQDPIAADHRIRLLLWDWMPFKLSLSCISAVLCIVILLLPKFRGGYCDANKDFYRVCLIAAIMPFIGAVFQFISCVSEGRYLLKKIRSLESQEQKTSRRSGNR
jgi:hypothetical protein